MTFYQKNYWERKKLLKRRSPQHLVVAAYVLPKIEEIKKTVPLTKETTLLDVGCGNGFFTHYFDKVCDVYGIDFSKTMLKMNPVKSTLVMDANQLGFRDNAFEVVFERALLHHVDDMDNVIREMKRVSRKYLIILEPNRNNPLKFLFSLFVKEERKALRFSLRFLKELISRNGLCIIDSFSFGMITPNRTPQFLIPLLRLFNFKQSFGMTNFIIAKK